MASMNQELRPLQKMSTDRRTKIMKLIRNTKISARDISSKFNFYIEDAHKAISYSRDNTEKFNPIKPKKTTNPGKWNNEKLAWWFDNMYSDAQPAKCICKKCGVKLSSKHHYTDLCLECWVISPARLGIHDNFRGRVDAKVFA